MDGLYESILVYIITPLSIPFHLVVIILLNTDPKITQCVLCTMPTTGLCAQTRNTLRDLSDIDRSRSVCEYLRAAAAAYLNQPIHAIRGARAPSRTTLNKERSYSREQHTPYIYIQPVPPQNTKGTTKSRDNNVGGYYRVVVVIQQQQQQQQQSAFLSSFNYVRSHCPLSLIKSNPSIK